jgi:adenylyltransferase/sulfurtransferase
MSLAGRSALVIGAGGLGGPALIGLAAAGVGRLTLLDDDRVDATNLGRQVLFGDADVGHLKAEVAAGAISSRFPAVRVEPHAVRFSSNSLALVRSHDLVLDGSDNFETRFLANDLCVEARVPLIHGAALRWLGQLLTILPGETACLRCVFEGEPPEGAAPNCAQSGVLSPLVGLVGGWMAAAAVDLLEGRRPASAGAMRVFDAWSGRDRMAPVGLDPACRACGKSRSTGSGI